MKIVLDTNVLIDFFRNPDRKAHFESRTKRPLLYMSSVVAMELFAGCRTTRQRKAMGGFLKPFEKAGRLIVPQHRVFLRAGEILAKLGTDGMTVVQRRQMVGDILMAVSAADAGVIVVTANVRHFERIANHTPLQWMQPWPEDQA